jgi:hypothetical protein
MYQRRVIEKIKTHILFNNALKVVSFMRIIWKNVVDLDGPQMATV